MHVLTLGQCLHADGLVVREGVVLRLDAGVVDEGPGVGDQAAHGGADVGVDLGDLLHGGRVEEGAGQALLDGQDAAALGLEADGGGAQLDGLDGILDLEQAALGAEGVDSSVVFGSG